MIVRKDTSMMIVARFIQAVTTIGTRPCQPQLTMIQQTTSLAWLFHCCNDGSLDKYLSPILRLNFQLTSIVLSWVRSLLSCFGRLLAIVIDKNEIISTKSFLWTTQSIGPIGIVTVNAIQSLSLRKHLKMDHIWSNLILKPFQMALHRRSLMN